MKTHIWVTCKVPGFHQWMGAPADVRFLSDIHRHEFHIKMTVNVSHQDREVEFFTLQNQLKSHLESAYPKNDYGYSFYNRSCEMIATDILSEFKERGYNIISVEVSEDNENGAIVYE